MCAKRRKHGSERGLCKPALIIKQGGIFLLYMISKVLSGYGIILTMNLFFIIMPKLTEIQFFDDSFQNGIVRILFIIGGAFAVTKANLVISQLTGASAGMSESQQMMANMRTGMNITRGIAGTAIGAAGILLGGAKFAKSARTGGVLAGFADTFKGDGGGTGGTQSALSGISNPGTKGSSPSSAASSSSSTGKKIASASVKMAALPLKVLKDMASGGLLLAGKNFVPRLKKIVGTKNKAGTETASAAIAENLPGVPEITDIANDGNIADGEEIGGGENDKDNT